MSARIRAVLLIAALATAACGSAATPATPVPTPAPTGFAATAAPTAAATPSVAPTMAPTAAPTPNAQAEAMNRLLAMLRAHGGPATTPNQIKATIAAAYTEAPGAEAIVPKAELLAKLAVAGSPTSGVPSIVLASAIILANTTGGPGWEQAEAGTAALTMLVQLYGGTLEQGFATAASLLTGYLDARKDLSVERAGLVTSVTCELLPMLHLRRVPLSGKVTDSAGMPIPRLEVSAFGGCDAPPATTDGQGLYTFAGLISDTYTVMTQSSGTGYPAGVFYSTAGVTFDDAKATAIVIGDAPVTGIDIVVPVGTRISGVVIDKMGKPWAGVEISAEASGANGAILASTYALTAADGTFSFGVVPGHSYLLAFMPHNQTRFIVTASGPKPDAWDSAKKLVVGTTPITGLSVKLPVTQ